MFAPNGAASPEEYMAALPEPRQAEMRQLDALIRQTVPKLKPHMQSGMVGYGSYHYKTASGREGDWPPIAIASRKNYISVYISVADANGYLAEQHKAELPKADIGKSCIRFKTLADIDLDVLVAILRKAETMPFSM